MKRGETKQGGAAAQGMLDAIDASPPGAVYVMSVENGGDYTGIGALMATGMNVRELAGAVIDATFATPRRSRSCNSRCSVAAWFRRLWWVITASRA